MYRLTESFPYLVNRVGVRIGEVFSRRLARHGLTLPMYRVLAALWERDGQSLGELAEATSIELSTLSRLIGTMTTHGHVQRRRSRADARAVRIGLTETGRGLAQEMIPLARQHEQIALRGFDAEAAARLKQDLEAIYRNLIAFESEMEAEAAREEAQ